METDISTVFTASDAQNQLPVTVESDFGFPLDNSMRVLFTGYYNGLGVEIKSADEISLLYHMGCFGKGSTSRSKPKAVRCDDNHNIMRKRQFLKRISWTKKFKETVRCSEPSHFLEQVDKLTAKILASTREGNKDVIDLISSDDDITEVRPDDANDTPESMSSVFREHLEKEDFAIVVPNSDSENENYFENFKPKCCLNKVKLEERLILSFQEAFFLAYGLGSLQIVDENKPLSLLESWKLFTESDNTFVIKYVVYHYFRSKGYVVKPGIKFGGDYLLYKGGPAFSHADYIVVIKSKDQEEDEWLPLLGQIRMAATAVKEILLAEVHKTSEDSLSGPEDLSNYSVREILLKRNLPYNADNDE